MSGNVLLASDRRNAAPIESLYSQHITCACYHYISAQLPRRLGSQVLVAGGIEQQATQCFANIQTIVESVDGNMDDILRVTVFVQRHADIAVVNAVYAGFFQHTIPALAAVVVPALPQGALLQVEALLAGAGGAAVTSQYAEHLIEVSAESEPPAADGWPARELPVSHFSKLSAHLPIDPETAAVVPGSVSEQVWQCLANIDSTLATIGFSFDDVLKVAVHLSNTTDQVQVNEACAAFFATSNSAANTSYMPARTLRAVSGLPAGVLLYVEAIVCFGVPSANLSC